MFWLVLLGAVTVLVIALRRVQRRQKPLDDEVYSSKIAVDHVQSGVAWIKADGRIGSINGSLAETLGAEMRNIAGRDWAEMFPVDERERVLDSYRQMLLMGTKSFDAYGLRGDGSFAFVNVRLVAVHDHRMRFVGHHCLMLDLTRERILEEQLESGTPVAIGAHL